MEKISAGTVIIAMAMAASCAFPDPSRCSTDADCGDDDDVKCIDATPDKKACAYCLCVKTNQCKVTNGNANGNANKNANNGNGNAYGTGNSNNKNGNAYACGYDLPTATCNCDEDNTAQPYCKPTCAYSPKPCGEHTNCEDNDGTEAANCTCQDGFVGNATDGCTKSFRGCYKDDSNRILLPHKYLQHDQMTNELCMNHCAENNYKYAATQHLHHCYCGNCLNENLKRPAAECGSPCVGDTSQTCGGPWRGSVYQRY